MLDQPDTGTRSGPDAPGCGLPRPRDLLTATHFSEYHECVIDAPIHAVRRAMFGLTNRQVRPLRPLMAVRSLPVWLLRRTGPAVGPDCLLFDSLAQSFEILAREPDGYVFVMIGQPHRILPGRTWAVGSADEFTAFEEPGYCKIAADFRVREQAGRTVVSTETLVGCTDPATRRAFARYWLVIRPFSGLIRRGMLAGIRRCVRS